MATTSPNLSMNILASGDSPGAWATPINANWTIIDDLFHGTTGHGHTGVNGDGPQLDHDTALTNNGSNTHADIDTHIADSTLHFLAGDVAVDVTDGTTTVSGVSVINFVNSLGVTDAGGGQADVDVGSTPTGGTGPTTGTPAHLSTTYAAVAVTDYFHLERGRALPDGNWTEPYGAGSYSLVHGDRSALLSVDVSRGDPATGYACHRIWTAVPHSEVQRVTLEVERCAVEDFEDSVTDNISFQLALMSSAISDKRDGASINPETPSRLGFFFKIDLWKDSGGNVNMTRSLRVGSRVGDDDKTVFQTLWQDTGQTDAESYDYRGVHEFSLDRNHAFHYYFNHGPVDLLTAGQSGAATPYLATLRASLLDEYNEFSQAVSPRNVAPEFGYFGFDVEWNVPESGAADLVIKHFTATSTDDEQSFYERVFAGGTLPAAPVPAPFPADCCTSGVHVDVQVGDIIDVPAKSSSLSVDDVKYLVTSKVSANDPTYLNAGFTLRPLADAARANIVDDVAYCAQMANVVLNRETEARPGAWGRIRLTGDNLTSLIDDPVFKPSDPTVALPDQRPAGVGTYPQATPYPDPQRPGVGDSATFWAKTLAVDERVIKETVVTWDSGDLIIDFLMADGLPLGASYDLTITDRLDVTNTVTITNAIILSAPNTDFLDVRFYIDNPAGGPSNRYLRTEDLTSCQKVYVVAYARGLPLDIDPATNGTEAQTVWNGFSFSITDVAGAYNVFEENQTSATTNVTVNSSTVLKGWYREEPTTVFPPSGVTPETLDGETLFMTVTFDVDTYDDRYYFEAQHPESPSAQPGQFFFPRLGSAAPVITDWAISPNADADPGTKTVTVNGTCFHAVTAVGSGDVASVTLTAQSSTQITFTCVTASAGTATVTITNESGAGGSTDLVWTVDSSASPGISLLNPSTVTAAAKNQTIAITGTNWDDGVYISTTPPVTFLEQDLDAVTDTGTVTFDVPDIGGSTIEFVANNPNGNSSAGVDLTVSSSSIAISSLTLDEEPGDSGTLVIAGSGFREGSTVTTNKGEYLILGDITALSASSISVDYVLDSTTPALEVIQVTVQDPSSGVSDSDTFTVDDNTPVITYVSVDNPREGAGLAGSATNSAGVAINGKYLNSANIASVSITTGNATITGVNYISDSLITLDNLAINAGESGNNVTIRLTTTNNAFTTDYTFVVEDYLPPKVSGWNILPSLGADPLDPKVIPEGASGYVVELYGGALDVSTVSVTGAPTFVGAPLSTTITQNKITIELNDVANPLGTADPSIVVSLTPFGTSDTYDYTVAMVDANLTTSAVTVSAVNVYEFYEGSKAAVMEITGTYLYPNRVRRVELIANDTDMLPLAVDADASGRDAINVNIVEYASDGTSLLCSCNIADLTAYAETFDLNLVAPDGTSVPAISNQVDVVQNALRVGFDFTALPSLTTTGAASVDYTFTLVNAEGGETLEVYNGTSVVNVSTASPTTVRVQFDNPAAANEVEIRLITVTGKIASIVRYQTT